MMRATNCIALLMTALLTSGALAANPIQVSCVGDSITHGSGANTLKNSYPDQLQRMLGTDYVVKNYGVSGATLLKNGDKPYVQQQLYKDSLDSKADIVIIMLGTNDTKPQNWKLKDQFEGDYKELIGQYQNLPSKPKIWLMLPPPVEKTGNYKIVESGIEAEVPIIQSIAKDTSSQVIDIHTAFENHGDLIPDNVHPNAAGYTILASTVYAALTGKTYDGPPTTVAAPPKTQPAKTQPAK